MHPQAHQTFIQLVVQSLDEAAFTVPQAVEASTKDWGIKGSVTVQTQLKRCEGACHGFIHFNTLRELTCAATALQEVAMAMREAVPDLPESVPF